MRDDLLRSFRNWKIILHETGMGLAFIASATIAGGIIYWIFPVVDGAPSSSKG